MARKRRIFFPAIQSLLKSLRSGRGWITQLLLALITAFLCTLVSPVVATPAVPSLTSSSAQTQNLVQQGKTLYEAGQFAEAVKVLQQAVSAFAAQGDKLRQAMTLSNLGLAYQQLGLWSQASAALKDSLNLLDTLQNKVSEQERIQVLAQALDIQGNLQLATGQAEPALTSWQQAAATYARAGDTAGVTKSRINSVQALQALGLYRRALTTLTELNQTLQKQPDSLTKAVGLRSLGDVLQLVGNIDESSQTPQQSRDQSRENLQPRKILQQILEIAQRLQSPQDISAAFFSLGNTARAQEDAKAALDFYQQAVTASNSPITRIQAQLNQLSLLLDQFDRELANTKVTDEAEALRLAQQVLKQFPDAEALWPQIQSQLTELPPSRKAVYARINFAQSLMRLRQATPANAPSQSDIAQMLETAVQQAKNLGDRRAEAYALGSLGGVKEQTQQRSVAKDLTQQALFLTQTIDAPDIAYRWEWQLGRLLKAQGDTQEAIAAYTEAVKTLQSLRGDLVAINPNVQFSFRESVEPVYRQLVGLLLESEQTSKSGQKNLDQARNVFESLQQAELVNFFRSECLDARPVVQIDQVDPKAAVIYPVILADRLEVILSLPQQPLRHYATSLPQSQVERLLAQLRQTLVTRTSQEFIPLSQQVYDWLIRPAEADLTKNGVKTLVFVLDGSLRNIPMAALHDGKQYLLEKYGVAITPGLQLLDPQPLKRGQLKALTAGVSEANQGFPALANVPLELNRIKSELPSTVLLNREFTSTALQNAINSVPFPVVHIASHGQFSSQANETFILTWDGRIDVNELDDLLQVRGQNQSRSSNIELLVLSACQTLAGDKRAALGLAGVAVRAGARSTVATLWNVNDAAIVPLMSQFYQELSNTTLTRAEALRRAQQTLLKNPQYRHPISWAPYVLVGNWL
jgi:CHAT domain-containing protein